MTNDPVNATELEASLRRMAENVVRGAIAEGYDAMTDLVRTLGLFSARHLALMQAEDKKETP